LELVDLPNVRWYELEYSPGVPLVLTLNPLYYYHMRLITDFSYDHHTAFLASDHPYPFTESLLQHLKKHDVRVTLEPLIQKVTSKKYDYALIIKSRITQSDLHTILKITHSTIIITQNSVLFENMQKTLAAKNYSHIKIARVDFDDQRSETIENVVWFFLSHESPQTLDLHTAAKAPQVKTRKPFKIELTRKQVWKIALVLFLAIEFFFIVPLIMTGFFIYRAGTALQHNNVTAATGNLAIAKPLLRTTEASYSVSRPVLLFFFLSLVPENIISIEKNGISFIEDALSIQTKAQELNELLLKTSKSPEEVDQTRVALSHVHELASHLSDSSANLKDLLDYPIPPVQKLRTNFETVHSYLDTFKKISRHGDELIGGAESKKYLLFFYNNMELRPGGGFIGSFAVVEFKNYSLYDFKVYDVYDADGQLEAHVAPPKAIRLHLGQPNWFLRDSNFSPDFGENVKTAEFFLEKELELTDFDGYAGITTTGLTYLLKAFGDVYVPDFNETINADNFYLKAQVQSEGNFFPGSVQKKSYLSTVGRALLLNVGTASPSELASNLKKAFDEKHMVLLIKNGAIQKDIDSLRWSGKVAVPECLSGINNCIINHLLSIDANVGVNKANYFVNKSLHVRTDVDNKGAIHNIVSTTFINNSPSDVFPGGTYKNYYQLFIPTQSDVKSVDIDGVKIEPYDEFNSGQFKVVGVVIEVEPKETSVVTIEYGLANSLKEGNSIYQFVVQKQIGSFNNDLSFELNLPDNVFVTQQNFASLAKRGRVVYNTDLSTDRIFVIDMVRE